MEWMMIVAVFFMFLLIGSFLMYFYELHEKWTGQ